MKKIIAICVSLLIMGVIFSRIDLGAFRRYILEMNYVLLAVAVLLFIPQVLVTAYRWKELVRHRLAIGMGESIKLILAGNALNILLPSRMGDLSKAYFLKKEGKLAMNRGMNVVLFEKYIDLASLGIVVLTGILWDFKWNQANVLGLSYALTTLGVFPVLYFLKLDRWASAPLFEKNRLLSKIKNFLGDAQQYLFELKANPRHLAYILALSIVLWFLHIFQFYFFFRALHSEVAIFDIFRLVPLAILVGLIPITLAGVGTRDTALIYFFSPYEAAAKIAGVGLFASLRYFVPGILGLPFLNQYMVKETAAK